MPLRYQVVDCIHNGFAVGGPATRPGADLELIQWGMTLVDAQAMADRLNAEAPAGVNIPEQNAS